MVGRVTIRAIAALIGSLVIMSGSAVHTAQAYTAAPSFTPRPNHAQLASAHELPGPVQVLAVSLVRKLPHTAAKPAVKKRPAAKHTTRFVAGPTSWSALNAAIARIPSYKPGIAKWVVEDTGWWATADWFTGTIYVSPSAPQRKLYDIVVHEWSHILQVNVYGGDVQATKRALKSYFGGSGLDGAEYAADCMAKLQGAQWTHYTSCSNSHWRDGARRLLAGQRL
ncbi:MAG: hypothetical protein QOG53_1901 [Frankiales bacterium]|jgi:hypothetical protein|nr:hypothetical protein [Frankiales bacterium]